MKSLKALAAIDLATSEPVPPASPARFEDGGAFRVEIPTVEGPAAAAAVFEEAKRHGITVNRISQGSGGMLLSSGELHELVDIAQSNGAELALFVGPRAEWDTGAFSRSGIGASQHGSLRGMRGLSWAVEDVYRAVETGVRSFLVADLGLLSVLSDLRSRGDLPADCLWKVSAYLAPSNPATLRVLENLGAGSINIVSDVSVADLADMRKHVSVPIDLYLEAPDSMGGIIRGNEIGSFVEAGAPLYAKFGLRNAATGYPAGQHLAAATIATSRERVRRAALALEWLKRTHPDLPQSPAVARNSSADGGTVPR